MEFSMIFLMGIIPAFHPESEGHVAASRENGETNEASLFPSLRQSSTALLQILELSQGSVESFWGFTASLGVD